MKALITGASSGIGRELAKELSGKGYDLVLAARNTEKLKELQKELRTKTQIVTVDLSSAENCRKLYREHRDIDLLVNNAGFGDCGYFTSSDLDKELQMIHTNIIACHVLMKLYLRDMKKKDQGIILNVASLGGFLPGPLMASYYATKAYVVRLSEAVREELKKQHSRVQVSILCPGPVNTNFNQVAGVSFSLKGLDSTFVAKYTVKKLHQGKFYIVPGWSAKAARLGAKLAPAPLSAKVSYRIQKKKID